LLSQIIAFEIGKNFKTISINELQIGSISKNINNLFNDAKKSGCVVVIESNSSVDITKCLNLLMYSIEKYSGIVLLIMREDEFIKSTISEKFRFILEFKSPDVELRKKLWVYFNFFYFFYLKFLKF
jgi:SpoVK/Ycf46/Vps4 family AAA+-type ATPase